METKVQLTHREIERRLDLEIAEQLRLSDKHVTLNGRKQARDKWIYLNAIKKKILGA